MQDYEAFYGEVGRRIHNARKDRKLTQEELACRVSLTRTSITNIEKGRQKLLLHKLADIGQDTLELPAKVLLQPPRGAR